jgi:hypothetical protein
MKYFNYYRIKSKGNYVWSIRLFYHTVRVRLEKVKNKWRLNLKYMKLYNLDLIPFYYEVGFIKYSEKKDN